MYAYSYLDIKEDQLDKFIYRIVPYHRFTQIIKNNEFGFIRPHRWDDPYENFLLNQDIKLKNGGSTKLKDLSQLLYGSCWTLNSNSDYAWRVYAPNKDGVQIKIKIQDLFKVFEYLKEDKNLDSFQIGKVRYLRWKKLKNLYEGKTELHPFKLLNNAFCFDKRFEYRHEKEIRILIKYHNHVDDLLLLPFNLNKVCSTIILDPRIPYSHFTKLKEETKSNGFEGRVYRSLLYTAPKLNIEY